MFTDKQTETIIGENSGSYYTIICLPFNGYLKTYNLREVPFLTGPPVEQLAFQPSDLLHPVGHLSLYPGHRLKSEGQLLPLCVWSVADSVPLTGLKEKQINKLPSRKKRTVAEPNKSNWSSTFT